MLGQTEIRYAVFAWFLATCYGFVLLSSAAGQNGEEDIFRPGTSVVYELHTTLLLNEKGGSSKNVGFYITGDVVVDSLWGVGDERVLKIQLRSPRLHIRSRKAPSPDGFIQHDSKLEQFSLKPFLVVWKRGKIDKVLTPKNEPLSLRNMQKGLASLFQFQLLDQETTETDSSGECTVIYTSVSPNKFQKAKLDCQSVDLPIIRNPEPILETIVRSSRRVDYELDETQSFLKTIHAKERHEMYVAAKEQLGNSVEASQILTFRKTDTCKTVKGADLEKALQKVLDDFGEAYTQESLLTEREEASLGEDKNKVFTTAINELRDSLKADNLGTAVSAKAFAHLVGVARRASREDIAKALSAKKNQKILSQLYDVLGYVQTEEAYETVLKKLHFDKEDHLDLSERYLWASSLAAQPNPEIVSDLLKKYLKYPSIPEKVKDTLIMTVASMANKLQQNTSHHHYNRKVISSVEEAIINGLDYAKDDARFVFLRALKNLRSPSTIPALLKTIKSGTAKEGVLAFKALSAFDEVNDDVLKASRTTFLQLDRKHDTSSRTLAVDILLENSPEERILHDFLQYLKSNDTSYEVKQYVLQRMQMLADVDQGFRDKVLAIIRADPSLNNYSVLSPKGLSTALKRSFMRGSSSNGSLLTVQEIFSGIVKRGVVNVVLDKDGASKEILSLGIFSGGLSSFVSSDVEGDEETATAGMELTILGAQIRPFVFFTGQGELMGHVWAGTASDKTTAFQTLALLQDHQQYLRLAPGFVAELDLKGAMSFDLSGKVELSIWNRNADSLVDKSAGVVVRGSILIDTEFVRSQSEFVASIEPKLSLQSNVDFSSNMMLCMQVYQPDSVFKHNIFKTERIPGSQHRLRIAKYQKTQVPGTTYSLNRKNNEMCSAMFGS